MGRSRPASPAPGTFLGSDACLGLSFSFPAFHPEIRKSLIWDSRRKEGRDVDGSRQAQKARKGGGRGNGTREGRGEGGVRGEKE